MAVKSAGPEGMAEHGEFLYADHHDQDAAAGALCAEAMGAEERPPTRGPGWPAGSSNP